MRKTALFASLLLFAAGILGGLLVEGFSRQFALIHFSAALILLVPAFPLLIGWMQQIGSQAVPSITPFFRRTVVSVLLGAAVFAAFFSLSRAVPGVLDLSSDQLAPLPHEIRSMIASQQEPLLLLGFLPRDAEEAIRMRRIMRRLHSAAPNTLSYEIIDPALHLELLRSLGASSSEAGYFIRGINRSQEFQASSQSVRTAPLRSFKLSELESALMVLSTDSRRPAFFTTGHEESSLYSEGAEGLKKLVRVLKSRGFEAYPLEPEALPPSEAEVLFMIGARFAPSAAELDHYRSFLEGGGHLVVALEPHTAAAELEWLREFGFQLGPKLVLSTDGSQAEQYGLPVQETGKFRLSRGNGQIVFDSLRVVEHPRGEEILLYRLPPQYAASGKKELPVAASLSFRGEGGRLTVFGGNSIFQNRGLPLFSHASVVQNLLRTEGLASSPQPVEGVQLLSDAVKDGLLITLFVLVELLLLMGLFVWGRRQAFAL